MATRIIIAKRGDVMLKLGRDDSTGCKALVSSTLLSVISPVFQAMFQGPFSESRALSVSSPPTIPLKDDDQQAMLLICRIAHFQTSELPNLLRPIVLADFAVACDKYQCADAVQAWSKVWIAKALAVLSSDDFDKILFVTYVLDLPEEFEQATLTLIRNRTPDVNFFVASHGHELLPSSLFLKLWSEKRNSELRVYNLLHTATSGLGNCDATKAIIGGLIVRLREAGVWPIKVSCVGELYTRILQMGHVEKVNCPKTASCYYCSRSAPDIKNLILEGVRQIDGSMKGFCLDCIKREALDVPRVCRIDHPTAVKKLPASA